MGCIEIRTCTNNIEETKKITDGLLKLRLASCVHIEKIESHYIWKDKLEIENEFLLVIKTTSQNLKEITNFIRATHSYELPEITWQKIGGTKEFLKWIKDNSNKVIN